MGVSKEAELAALMKSAPDYDPSETQISITTGLAGWMLANKVSLAFTSYQTGQLILAGVAPDGRISFNEQNYARAMGLYYHARQLHVGSMFQIWRLENMLKPGQFADRAFDLALVPRTAQSVGYVDAHELAVDRSGRTIFVNSRFSCLATFDEQHSFRPLWKPPFISALMPEDRCHLNGMAMVDGVPRYVTAIAATDTKDGWRACREKGGVLIEVETGRIVTDGLSMPHSPRVHQGAIWAVDSGRGKIVKVDRRTGETEDVIFCPGFLRGLTFHNGHAIVTASKAREGGFEGLELQAELKQRAVKAACGVFIIDLERREIVHSILFEGKITEMFDVAVMEGIRNPMSVGPNTVEMIGAVSFEEAFAPLNPS